MKYVERVANLALAGLTLAPLVVKVDPNLNVVLTACLTVFVGCYRSVKPTPPTETMSNEHAMRFPFVGSAMLLSLFLLFKFLSKDLVNAVLTSYFFVLGIIALSATLLPAIKRYLPKHWNEDLIVWRFPYFCSLEIEFTRSQVVAAIPGTFFCAWYASQKHWLANNILGLAFCIQLDFLCMIFSGFSSPQLWLALRSLSMSYKGDSTRPFSMLGLGDIEFCSPGFAILFLEGNKASILGVRYGLHIWCGSYHCSNELVSGCTACAVYIVPAVIGFLAAHLLEFDESKASQEDEDDKVSSKEE
ncbi:hypothetical protein G4B88_016074 [Cannabis sativa]|uniref:Signal peptide peptidase n=1 Tax=Cannabis sativa TaxID=3483 RepID=A0A7J6EXU2_CANSA|nr:hypothetical protein G4B88_016074 [Cannabis sativa]